MPSKSVPTRLSAILMCAAIAACSVGDDPQSQFHDFTKESGQKASFSFVMSDSACVYAVDLMARFIKGQGPESVTADIIIVSPSGITGTETVTLPSDYSGISRYLRENPSEKRIDIAGTTSYYDIRWQYRSGIIPQESGTWTMNVSFRDSTGSITGAGIIVTSGGQMTPNDDID